MIRKEFYFSPVLKDIHDLGTKRAGYDYVREAIFIRLLSLCAGGVEFISSKHLSVTTGCPENQCELVWGYCLSKSILRESAYGMSTNEWLVESGYSPSKPNRANLPPNRDFKAEATKDTSEPQTPPKVRQISQVNGIAETECKSSFKTDTENTQTRVVPPKRQPLIKEAVRHNVWLDRDEMAQLLKTITQEELTMCLDYYSDWKGKNCVSKDINDFKQINKWVIRSVRQKKSTTRNSTDIDPDDFQEFLDEYVKG